MPPESMTVAGPSPDVTGDRGLDACAPSSTGDSAAAAKFVMTRPTDSSSSCVSAAPSASSGSELSGSSTHTPGALDAGSADGEAGPQQALLHNHVPHCKQFFSWDCGLACVQMVLQAAGFAHCDYRILRQLCTTTSIWTVDLAHLLRRFGLRVSFYTVTLGPNPAYANESFYMENMEDDERRVSQLFVEAAHVGIAVEQRSVSSEELQSWMLSGGCLIIVLVDKRKLDPWLGAGEPGSGGMGGMGGMSMSMCLPAVLCGMELGYAGHYVLLVGFDAATQEYTIRDPAAQVHTLRVTAAALDAARRSFGTDEDILVVSTTVGNSCGSSSSSSCTSSAYSGVPAVPSGGGSSCTVPSGLQQLLMPHAQSGCHPQQQELLMPLGIHHAPQQPHHSHHHHHNHHHAMPRPVATQQTAAGLHAG